MSSSHILVCALSGQSPIVDPVVTPTGQICSKKLLLQKLIETNYTNPFSDTGTPLDESQLVELSSSTISVSAPKPATANSIPSILNTLSSEYDSLVLELYDTRKALEDTRKELSVALYQNDAAIRVIARVVLERDVARRQLAEASTSTSGSVAAATGSSSNKRKRGPNETEAETSKKVNIVEEDADVSMKDDTNTEGGIPNQIPSHISTLLQDKWSQLFKARKNKTKPTSNHASVETISSFAPTNKKYHTTSVKGVASLVATNAGRASTATADKKEQVLVSIGKSDKQLVWYNTTKHQIQKTESLPKPILNKQSLSTYDNNDNGHNQLTAVITNDYILHVFKDDRDVATLVLDNEDEIVGLCIHPTCQVIFLCTVSGKIVMVHIKDDGNETLSLEIVAILQGFDEDDVNCTSIGLHPDGLILALGRSDGKVCIWDLKTEKLASLLEESSDEDPSASIERMTFSEKGYHVAVSTIDGYVAVWDLRKQKKVATIACSDDDKAAYATALSFDPVGKYLAFGTCKGSIIVTPVKEWDNKTILDVGGGKKKTKAWQVTGLVWGADAQVIVSSVANDRTVKFWGVPE